MFLSLSSMSRNYLKLTDCMENICSLLGCFFPNRVVEQLFVRIHQQYFSLCNNEEDLSDAPAGVVLVSTLLPILLIPFIVYIVVWKSSLRDWRLLRYPGWVKVIQILSLMSETCVNFILLKKVFEVVWMFFKLFFVFAEQTIEMKWGWVNDVFEWTVALK